MESRKTSQITRYQREVLQNIQEFVNEKEEQEHFSQCGSKKNEEQPAQKQENMIKHHVFRKPIVF